MTDMKKHLPQPVALLTAQLPYNVLYYSISDIYKNCPKSKRQRLIVKASESSPNIVKCS